MNTNRFSLAIVGGGPNSTYALERLAVMVAKHADGIALDIHVFEKTGEFGAGWVHSPTQPVTSMLNRIVGQLAFAADESNDAADGLLPSNQRPTFLEWCRQKYAETGDDVFNLKPEDWPRRHLHGLALTCMFQRYVELLRTTPGVAVHLHAAEVVDVEKKGERYLLRAGSDEAEVIADHLLFLTGHSQNRPVAGSLEQRLIDHSQSSDFEYVPFAYPLEKNIPAEQTASDCVVGCIGLGLTAIDVILYLTEGRGGRFIRQAVDNRLIYIPSGNEPARIVGVSQSGLFTAARPFNAKEVDLDRLEHKGVFLTTSTIDRLRAAVGTPIEIPNYGEQRQLDFERHLFPVVMLEMACLYYKVLFGPEFGAAAIVCARERFESFVSRPLIAHGARDEGVAYLCGPVDSLASDAVSAIGQIADGAKISDVENRHAKINVPALILNFFTTVFGEEFRSVAEPLIRSGETTKLNRVVAQWRSPWLHSLDPQSHVFSWQRLINPLLSDGYRTPPEYTVAITEYMERDHLEARQGNVANPCKAACDGVWRDLRQTLAYCADYGGMTASSHSIFLRKYMRYHNRLANGACVEVMEKMLALVYAGILDVSTGPDPVINVDQSTGGVEIYGPRTGARTKVDIIVDAKLHDLDVRRDATALYTNLMQRGYVRPWRNPSHTGASFEPGGLDLTETFHPVGHDGKSNERMTFLGPSSEGFVFFQVGSARPNQNHHVLNDIIHWVKRFEKQLLAQPPRAEMILENA